MQVWRSLGIGLCVTLASLASLAALADVAYDVAITGPIDKDLKSEIEGTSQLVKLKDREPPSEAALRRRAETDLEQLKNVVNGAGYWEAKLDLAIDEKADPAKVTVTIEPGPLYTLEKVIFQTPGGGPPPVLDQRPPSDVGLELGKPARSAPVVAAETRIAEIFAREAHPYGKVVDRKVVIDVATHTMTVTYTVDPGPAAAFGPFRIEGLEKIPRAYVERRIEWRAGAPYDSRLVEKTRKTLVDSALFSAVRIEPAPQPDADGTVPIAVTLTERLARSVGAGLNYNTSEGFGARAFWENRNLFGGAEKLRVTLDFAQDKLGATANFRQPDLLGDRNQDLVLLGDLGEENPDAYDSRRLKLSGGVERRFGTSFTAGTAIGFEESYVTDALTQQRYTLVGLPSFIRQDTSDDLLNPKTGSRSSLQLAPWSSIAGTSVDFVAARATHSRYYAFDDAGRFIGAAFGAVGTILGPQRETIPADHRLYVGGGGSVRGFGYQRAGPLGPNDKPIGGKGSIELGMELRTMVTQTIGLVPFLEAGGVDSGAVPKGKMFYGAGLGLRYLTAVGPVRLDIGVPINPRPSDDSFQLYISLGQAF